MCEQVYGDPHRGQCHWDGVAPETLRPGAWFSTLDWAVYHAPGWEAWQAFRGGLVGTPMTERHACIEAWTREHYGNPTEWGLAELVRVTNLYRSLRGQFSAHPELRHSVLAVDADGVKGYSERWVGTPRQSTKATIREF